MAEILTCVLMWLGRRVAARGICLSLQIGHILRNSSNFTISPTNSTTGRHLGFERDYNYHTAFRACYVIMHKEVYFCYKNSYGRVGTERLYFTVLL